MAGEAWRSSIPEEKSDSDLRQERWAAEAGSEVAGWLVLAAFLFAVGMMIGAWMGS